MTKDELLRYLNGFIIYNTDSGTRADDLYGIFDSLEEYFGYNEDNFDEETANVLKTIKGLMDSMAVREAEVWHKRVTKQKQTAWWIEIMRHEGAKL